MATEAVLDSDEDSPNRRHPAGLPRADFLAVVDLLAADGDLPALQWRSRGRLPLPPAQPAPGEGREAGAEATPDAEGKWPGAGGSAAPSQDLSEFDFDDDSVGDAAAAAVRKAPLLKPPRQKRQANMEKILQDYIRKRAEGSHGTKAATARDGSEPAPGDAESAPAPAPEPMDTGGDEGK